MPCMQFKKNFDEKEMVVRKSDIYAKVMHVNDKCKEINSGDNVMFNVTFSCQDSQPFIIRNYQVDRNHTVNKDEVIYPEKTMPIDTLRIEICFNYRNSISEFCKLTNYGMKNEEEIINSLITIIDHDNHQVYFKLKTNYFNEEMEQLYRYIVIGKMDDSQHAFIFDVSDFAGSSRTIPKDLKTIYAYCMPHDLAKYFDLNGNNCTNSDKSVRRVGFGMFFRADTKDRNRCTYWRGNNEYSFDNSQFGLVGYHQKNGTYGIQILAENGIYYVRGVIDVGYYKFKSVGYCKYESFCSSNSYTHKLTQQVKHLN